MTKSKNNQTVDTLESIFTDLLNEVFEGHESLEALATHLKWIGGVDLERMSVNMILNAITHTTRSETNWRDVSFGCGEVLCNCQCLKPQSVGIDPSKAYHEKLDMCAYLLAVGLLAKAARMQKIVLSDCNDFYQLMFTLYFYSKNSKPAFGVEHHIERLLKHIYRPGCP